MAETSFRRLVLFLSPGTESRSTELAITFASHLSAHLIVNLVQDKSAVRAAALPFVHEIDPQAGAWRTLDSEALGRAFERDASSLSERLQQQIHRAGVAADVWLPTMEATKLEAGDLWVLAEPADPLSRIANPFAAEFAAALAAERDVLFLPRETVARNGPVLALVASGEDRSISAAAFLARRLSRRLSIRHIADDGPAHTHLRSALVIEPALESLIVMTRGSFGLSPIEAIEIASSRKTPLLLLNPVSEEGDEPARFAAAAAGNKRQH